MRAIFNAFPYLVMLATVASCALVTSTADAQGFELGGRIGYGIPMGDAVGGGGSGNELSTGIAGQIPLAFDIGYRAIPELFVGGYLVYGIGFAGDDLDNSCDMSGVDCYLSTLSLGAQVQYHVAPGSGADFWFGGGLGYESLSIAVESGGRDGTSTLSGLPQLLLQLGVDLGDDPNAAFGPFVSVSFLTFTDRDVEVDGDSAEESIDETANHQWLTLGLRGTFVL